MLDTRGAAKLGIDACIGRLGRGFYEANHRWSACAYGKHGDDVYCFVGVDTEPWALADPGGSRLDAVLALPYRACCRFSLICYAIEFGGCVLPPLDTGNGASERA